MYPGRGAVGTTPPERVAVLDLEGRVRLLLVRHPGAEGAGLARPLSAGPDSIYYTLVYHAIYSERLFLFSVLFLTFLGANDAPRDSLQYML